MINMENKKVLIICYSTHHGSTLKVAKEIARELSAEVRAPEEVNGKSISNYDLIGFGSGIYNRKHHESLFALVKTIKPQDKKKSFVFSTNTFGIKVLHNPLIEKLKEKGFEVIGEFACKDFMDFGFTKYLFGGINKTKPDKNDLAKTKNFAKELIESQLK